ncbi:conserved hypothetical protein [Talaromyces stipitatus ATCC 10500]|uniref:Uncharacterized protein n=1 Tax=Talaromyces stipitatus (strain ATCC 10500 / CBS 375.48 / QM 6759 / NRRL 1006) TaxID=441959 RepID=B8MP79_TALSN|nr:uncharacterized protein TSTA_105300 [Talaromyces stipitatus ATCC 10500]EED14318.1 conserved hypothetical protein [Talaromyces stipitatus ATCC 10500]
MPALRHTATTNTTTTTTTETDPDSASLYSEHAALLLPSKDGTQPGFAPEQSLSRGLQIPSKTSRLTSGFEYPSILGTQYNISRDEWEQFTHEITESAKLSPSQWTTVIGVGMGIMAVGGMMVGFFGAIPAVIAAKRKRARQENENSLSSKITAWNETFFKPRGIMIRIDMPYDLSAVEDGLDVSSTSRTAAKKSPRKSSSPSHASSRQGSVSSSLSGLSADKTDRVKERYKASHRSRIVIIPLNSDGRSGSVMSQATTLAEESPYIPAVYN